MTHAELVERAQAWLYGTAKCAVAVTEYRTVYGGEEPDALGWRPVGTSILVECKATRSDFLADRRKACRAGEGLGSLRYYLTPPGVCSPDDLPPGWGLLVVQGRRVRVVVEAERRTADLATERRLLVHALRKALGHFGADRAASLHPPLGAEPQTVGEVE